MCASLPLPSPQSIPPDEDRRQVTSSPEEENDFVEEPPIDTVCQVRRGNWKDRIERGPFN